MRVVAEDGARPDGVTARCCDLREGLSDRLPLRVVEPDRRGVEERLCLVIEVAQLGTRGLITLALGVDRTELRELVLSQSF